MNKRWLQILSLTMLSMLFMAQAVAGVGRSEEKFPDFSAIPEPLRYSLRQHGMQSREQFVSNVLSSIRQNSKTKQSLNQQDVDRAKQKEMRQRKLAQIQHVLQYDENLDGTVMLDEVRNTLESAYSGRLRGDSEGQHKKYIDDAVSHTMAFDVDGSGVITWEEMATLREKGPRTGPGGYIGLESLLAIDPNHDGELAVDELEALAVKAFRTLDANDDGILSREESESIREQAADIIQKDKEAAERHGEAGKDKSEEQRIVETAAFVRQVEAAVATFRDSYNALPGDMMDAGKRLSLCEVNCGSGDGNGYVGDKGAPKKIELFRDERHLFWVHLRRAQLLGGYEAASHVVEWGKAFPAAPVGGGFQVYSYDGSSPLPGSVEGAKAVPGIYMMLTDDINGDFSSPDTYFLTPSQAASLDRGLDDGRPLSGKIIAAGDKKCLEEADSSVIYKENDDHNGKGCLSLYFFIQPVSARK